MCSITYSYATYNSNAHIHIYKYGCVYDITTINNKNNNKEKKCIPENRIKENKSIKFVYKKISRRTLWRQQNYNSNKNDYFRLTHLYTHIYIYSYSKIPQQQCNIINREVWTLTISALLMYVWMCVCVVYARKTLKTWWLHVKL